MELSFLVLVQLAYVGCTQAVDSLTAQVVNGVPGQQSPCLGQDIVHTCTFPSGQTTVNMEVHSGDEDISLALTFGSLPLQTGSLLGNTLIANLTSSTSAELLIVAINSALNESTVTCDTPGQSPQNLSRTVFVLGLPSGPVYTYDSITQSDFESINVTVQRPVYGWECVDEYTVVAQSDPGNVVNQSISVTTPGQLLTVVPLSGLDLCRNTYSLATFATSNGDKGQSFRRPGPYLPDISVLSNVVTNVLSALPLTMMLSWTLEPPPRPHDCVTKYSLSFNGSRFITLNTSVLPNELLDNGFPLCVNQSLKISPIIPVIGDIESSSTTVIVRVEEGFPSPQEVALTDFRLSLSFGFSLSFQFPPNWDFRTAYTAGIRRYYGYATNGEQCVPNSSGSQFYGLDAQQFIGASLGGCVTFQKNNYCTSTNESMEVIAPIAITASLHNISRGRDRFEITVIRNPSFAVDDLQVSIRPDAPVSVAISGDVFTVTVFGEDRTSYTFSIQGLDANRTPIGIPISDGSYKFVKPSPCGIGCIIGADIGVVCAVLLITVVIIGIVLLIKHKCAIRKWCHHSCVYKRSSRYSEVDTETHSPDE